MARFSSRCTTTAASSVGATLNRPPGASIRSSASKISASSEVGRCCVIRPHMPSLVSSGRMNEPPEAPFDQLRDPELDAAVASQGPLSEILASRLVARGRAALEAGEYELAIADFRRVAGHPEPDITGAALVGSGDAYYRMDDEARAAGAWEAATELPENSSTYPAWRRIAGVRVRAGDLREAIEAYREADRRAPAEDKSEIAARLGWLAKETGNAGTANRYFARSRGAMGLGLTLAVIVVTAGVSLVAQNDPSEGILRALWLDRFDIRQGDLYRLLSVTLVHGGLLHLFLNMYALWVIGPIVEQIWGRSLFVLFYVLTAIAASTASVLMSPGPAVGASGAVFGLIGVVLAGTRAHHPALDRQARGIVPQLGMFVIINLVFGFLSAAGGVRIDNAAHVGGLIAGLWLGFVVPPGKTPTLRSTWQRPAGEKRNERSPLLVAAGVIALVGLVAAGLAVGGATV
jgi:rhomboid protease GluP